MSTRLHCSLYLMHFMSSLEAQALLQSNSHGERLRLLREALRSEARRLAALNAVAESIGQEAQA